MTRYRTSLLQNIVWQGCGLEGIIILLRAVTYTSEVHTTFIRNRTVTIENKTPQLSEQERAEQYRAIECGLFDIFIKYEDSYLRAAEV